MIRSSKTDINTGYDDALKYNPDLSGSIHHAVVGLRGPNHKKYQFRHNVAFRIVNLFLSNRLKRLKSSFTCEPKPKTVVDADPEHFMSDLKRPAACHKANGNSRTTSWHFITVHHQQDSQFHQDKWGFRRSSKSFSSYICIQMWS